MPCWAEELGTLLAANDTAAGQQEPENHINTELDLYMWFPTLPHMLFFLDKNFVIHKYLLFRFF